MPSLLPNHVINLVITCTNRKATAAVASLQARSLTGKSIASRSKVWCDRISNRTDGIPAAMLYKGDHWSVVQSIASSRGSLKVNVWIASAGYGLISARSRVVAYAATLASGHADSVALSSEERRLWWASLTTSPALVLPLEPRSLRQLASTYSSSPLIIAASPEYIDAMADDILAASAQLDSPNLLSVLCRAGGAPMELESFAVTLSASFASELGGALTSLNARVIRWLVTFGTAELNRSTVKRYVGQLAERCTARVIPKRSRMSDAEIVLVIKREQKTQHRSRSALLRVLRERGYAVEQSRFGKIYNEVTEVSNAS
jgi:hypothetical protein